jgi:hypothetical protein
VGGVFQYSGSVSNSGDNILTNVYVFSQQGTNSTPVLGPIELAPGESEDFSGSYIVTGVTTVSTNVTTGLAGGGATSFFGTINPVSQVVLNRFGVPNNLSGLAFADQDEGYAATQFYSMRKDVSGTSFFDTITAGTGVVTDRFAASGRNFDGLAFAAPDVGYGSVIFYYLSHDNGGVSKFGTITPGGVVGVVADHFVVGSSFDSLTFAATDVGYGANLFYYIRHDAGGLSTFGTINPALPGTVTDRFTVGNNVDALVFTATDVGAGYGIDNFYYLRHNAAGVSTFGTIFVTGLTTRTLTDRFVVGTNVTRLTFAATDTAYGANLFYFLRGGGGTAVTTVTTNVVPAPASLRATGMDLCQSRTVTATATCSGTYPPVIGGPGVPPPHYTNGVFSVSFATEFGVKYTVQYKNSFNSLVWTDLPDMPITGNGAVMTITDSPGLQVMRFYRVVITP